MSSSRGDLLTVGQLARLAGLTTKALRHYDRIGLFRPALVEEESGYRWYTTEQVPVARLIGRLRSIDLPLQTIGECLAADENAIKQVLVAHQRRMESRQSRIRGQLHELGHLINDGLDWKMTTPTAASAPADEKALAISLYNGVWEYLGKENRTPADDDTMVHMAHASRYHWGNVGAPVNLARGEWLCSRVYAVLGRAESARYHAQRELDICRENGIGDWDVAVAYEALARSAAVAGNAELARGYTEQALLAAEDIVDPEDRAVVLDDLETIPGQPRFW
jgi:DNA-binding transcriptional MerR regulator